MIFVDLVYPQNNASLFTSNMLFSEKRERERERREEMKRRKELGPNGKRHGKSLQKNIQFTISGHSSSIEALVYMYMFPGKIFLR